MKRFLLVSAILLAAILAGSLVAASVHTKSKYDAMKGGLVETYAVTPMDQQTWSLLSGIQSNWYCRADITGGPHSDSVKLAGFTPTVVNLIQVLNYQMPRYAWFSPKQNRKAIVIGMVKAEIFPTSVDGIIYVSQDRQVAAIHCRTNAVYIFRDEQSGLRESLYFRTNRSIEPDGTANWSQPIRSETNRTSSAAGSRR